MPQNETFSPLRSVTKACNTKLTLFSFYLTGFAPTWALRQGVLILKLCVYVSWSISELRLGLAPWNRFKPSRKLFYWPFQGSTSFVALMFFLSCVCYAFVRVCLFVRCGHLLGKDRLLGPRLWCITVSLSLSHWYPGSGVVLDCIDSWSLHPYLL